MVHLCDPFFAHVLKGISAVRYHRSTKTLHGQPRSSTVFSATERAASQDTAPVHSSRSDSNATEPGLSRAATADATATTLPLQQSPTAPAPDGGAEHESRGEVFMAKPFIAKRVFDHWKDVTDRSVLGDSTADPTASD